MMSNPPRVPVVLAPFLAAFVVGGLVLALGLALHGETEPTPSTAPKVEAVGRLSSLSPVPTPEASLARDPEIVIPVPLEATATPLAEPPIMPNFSPAPSVPGTTAPAAPSASSSPTAPGATTNSRPPQPGPTASAAVKPTNQDPAAPNPDFVSSVVVKKVDLGKGDLRGMLEPILTGTAKPDALIHISNGLDGDVTVQADSNGHWQAGPLNGFQAGAGRIDLRAEDESAIVSFPFELIVPKAQIMPSNTGFFLSIIGPGGCDVEILIDGARWGQPITLQPNGNWGESLGEMSLGYHEVTVRMIAGQRTGPGITTKLRAVPQG